MELSLISDLLVFPIVITGTMLVKFLLLTVGISNDVVFLAALFLFFHIMLTVLMYVQIRGLQDTYITRMEVAAFAAVISSIVGVTSYIIIGALPILKTLFFFLKWLPFSKYWADLSIIAVPVYFSHLASRLVINGLLD
tara:strand:+ start:768 stop:1181 length:414 start_codon:yes stop_codon:yes gene_type:complete